MPNRLQSRVALITGASSGIGRATAILFASEGASVVCADLNEQSWRQPPSSSSSSSSSSAGASTELDAPTHTHILSLGHRAAFVVCDVTSPASVSAAVAFAAETFGRLDIMINNAGIAIGASDLPPATAAAGGSTEATRAQIGTPVWDISPEDWARQQRVNVDGVFYGIKFAAAQMLKQDPLPGGERGWILNAASVLGLVALEGSAAYCASKGAVANLTRAAALDCARHGIRVNAVNPGFVKTRLTDRVFEDGERTKAVDALHRLGGIGRPEDVAGVYLFLASEEARWVAGVNLCVDGGYTAR